MVPKRRQAIQRGLAAEALNYSTTLPLWVLRAAAQWQSTLNALPRIALIIGNSRPLYGPLKNSENDAKAIAGELQKVGYRPRATGGCQS
ncbi:MAG: caspase family protein [Betaproteobacteria bacterium]|nr:caspase family protein [Betaproteobacteria bacterium]